MVFYYTLPVLLHSFTDILSTIKKLYISYDVLSFQVGDNFSMTCGEPISSNYTYKWLVSKRHINASGKVLQVTHAAEMDAGRYRCAVCEGKYCTRWSTILSIAFISKCSLVDMYLEYCQWCVCT